MFGELIDIALPFRYSIQDFIDMRVNKNSAALYELLLKYECRHNTDRDEVLGRSGLRGTCRNECNSFSHEFRNKGNGNGFRRGMRV